MTNPLARIRPAAGVVLAVLLFLSGFGVGRSSTAPDPEIALMEEAHEVLRELAARSPEEGALSREAIRGMLAALGDAYADYLPVEPEERTREDLERRSLGVDVAALSDAAGISGRVLDGRLGYLGVRLFSPGSGAIARAEIERLRTLGVDGVVLDLRGNPGGLIDEALELAGAFVGERIVFRYQTAVGGVGERGGLGTAYERFVAVVLVDRETASAAELVAAAIQDHGRGLVVGERTQGKATVQRVVTLSDGSAIRFTTARYLTPSGRSIDGVGIRPDVGVTAGPGDRQLERARSILRATLVE